MVIVFPCLKRRSPDEGCVDGAMTDATLSHTDVQLVNQVAKLEPRTVGADTVSGGADPTSAHADSSDGESCDLPHSKRRKCDGSGIKFPANMTRAMPEASSSSYSYSKDALIVIGLVLHHVSKLAKKERKHLQSPWVVILRNRSVRMSLAGRAPCFSRCRRERCKSSCNL